MKAKVAKELHWEMSHRLPFHDGGCKNIHGHSYKARVELTGELDENGFLIDFYEIERIFTPIIQLLDHAFVCDAQDTLMLNFLKANGFKHYVIENTTTSENMATLLLDLSLPELHRHKNLEKVTIRFWETLDSFAEIEKELNNGEH
jgi:6-pyruvoyltetrahydropterin/6-carboxytetrahydropterin synthase